MFAKKPRKLAMALAALLGLGVFAGIAEARPYGYYRHSYPRYHYPRPYYRPYYRPFYRPYYHRPYYYRPYYYGYPYHAYPSHPYYGGSGFGFYFGW